MKTDRETEKAKPFRLVKYFTFSSLIVIFLGTLVLWGVNIHWARSILFQKNENYMRVLTENLSHQVFLQVIVRAARTDRVVSLRNPKHFQWLDNVVRNTLHSFPVERVNMYDIHENLITYSFQSELIGRRDMGGSGYLTALKGETASKLIQRGSFWRMFSGFPRDSLMVTYAPIRAEERGVEKLGTVVGVMEIEINVTDDYYTIFRSQILIVVTITLVMGILSLILIFVVKRGEGIIEKRALERSRLKEELSRAKHLSSLGELTAAISHEIRNPLGIIRSSAELLQKKVGRLDPHNTIPQVIVEEANRLNNIISDFLNYARPREPQRNPCQLEDIIDKNLQFLASQLESGQHRIHKYYSTPLPEILGDSDMLYQAFLNIFLNAMQAMQEPGDIQIEIFAGKRSLTIVIEDEGVGIADDVADKIWDPFFTTKGTGTGLGLGIVKSIIDAHNGQIRLESKRPLQGARVTVELPIQRRGTHGNHSNR